MILVALLLTTGWLFSFALPVSAASFDANNVLWGNQKSNIANNSGLGSATDIQDPRIVAAKIIRFILGFLGIIAVIIIVYAGFKWMLSGGNEETVSSAKRMLIAGVIGLAIILSAFAVAEFVVERIYNATTGRDVI